MNQFVRRYGKILLPLITPYREDERVDNDQYGRLIEYLLEKDLCDSFIVTGTTGEASLLTVQERVNLIKTALDTVKGRKPVIAGTGCASTQETLSLTQEAVRLGVETCMVVCPFYNKPTQQGIYMHFERLARQTGANIMLYNIPVFVGVNMEPETVARLAAIPNIVGIKDEAGINPTQITDYALATREVDSDFALYNGDDIMLLPTLIQGAMGLVSGGAHIFGQEIRAIFQAFEVGETARARALFEPIYRFCKSLGQNGRILPNSIMRPAVERVTGIRLGPPRLPLAPATDQELMATFQILEQAGKL